MTYLIKDYKNIYKSIMQFDKNKSVAIHQWYPFVEGYSKEFIQSIIEEINYRPTQVLDPFVGSGTTAVELQNMGIKCLSFEVSPFMHLLSRVKLESRYSITDFEARYLQIESFLNQPLLPIRQLIKPPKAKTFQPNKTLKKWVFNRGVMDGILDIKYAISLIDDKKYKNLFEIALAAILLEVSNVYRNGKCLSYKKGWKENIKKRRDVHSTFLGKLNNQIRPDIHSLEKKPPIVENSRHCQLGDVRYLINTLEDNSIDLVITSPPYLNSRDYTDIYIAELWILDLIKDYDELRQLRQSTFTSHVQSKHIIREKLNISILNLLLEKIISRKADLWNPNLPSMIEGYFIDMHNLFSHLKQKMMPNKKVYFNVANSAYLGIEIQVDEIVSEIAERNGFIIDEIREARRLKSSGQQRTEVNYLRESVIVMTS